MLCDSENATLIPNCMPAEDWLELDTVQTAEAVKCVKRNSSLCVLNDLKLPGCFKRETTVKDMQVHAFVDAFAVARGAV